MKTPLAILLALLISASIGYTADPTATPTPTPPPTMEAVDFAPGNKAALILRTEINGREYVRVQSLDTALLPIEAQTAISAGLAWLGGQLGDGYTWTKIALRRIRNGIPAEYDDSDPPVEITPAQDRIVAAVYGEHPDLGQSVIPQGTLTLPPILRIGLLAIWADVEVMAQSGTLPQPSPSPSPTP